MKLKILSALALCAVVLVGGVACKDGSSSGGMTAEQIIQNMEAAQLNCSSSHVNATEVMSWDVKDSDFGNYTMRIVTNITGDMDSINKKKYMCMAITMDMGTLEDTAYDPMNIQMYVVDDWVYTTFDRMVDATGNAAWMKTELTETQWEQERNSLLQNEELLEDALEVNIVGEETMNGVVCWKLDVEPDMAQILSWAQTQLAAEMVGLSSDNDSNAIFKDVTVTAWVAKDTYYTVRCDMTMARDVDGNVMDVSMTMNQSQFNQPVTITLPAVASNATDTSSLEVQH